METLSDPTPDMLAMPRFDDGAIDMQELLRRLAEQVVNAVMDAEDDQLCGGGSNSRNGYRERSLATCVGTLTPRIQKLRTGSFFADDVIDRYQRVDHTLVAAVAEMYATGMSTRKVQRVAEKMGVFRLSKDQVSAIASSLDADIEELCARPLDGSPAPYVWLDATYVKWRRDGGASWASTWWTPSLTTRGSPFCGLSARTRRRKCGSSSRTPTRDSSGRSASSNRVPHGSVARSTSCVGPSPGSSGATWAGLCRRFSAGATLSR